jgi:hypothetical protein
MGSAVLRLGLKRLALLFRDLAAGRSGRQAARIYPLRIIHRQRPPTDDLISRYLEDIHHISAIRRRDCAFTHGHFAAWNR